MQTATSPRFSVLAVNDEQSSCQCCGRDGLKRVVWIRDAETGEVKHFGTTCALSPVKGFGIDKEIKAAVRKATGEEQYRKSKIYARAHGLYVSAGGKYRAVDGKPFEFVQVDRELWLRLVAEVANGQHD